MFVTSSSRTVSAQRQHVAERRSRLAAGEDEDAAVVVAQLELALREDHPVGDLAAQLGALELRPARQDGARQGDRDRGAGAEVPRAADDLPRLVLPHVDAAELEPVGIRVLSGLEHPADAVQAEVSVDVGDADPFEASTTPIETSTRAASSSSGRSISTYSLSQLSGIFMARTAAGRGGRSPRTGGSR